MIVINAVEETCYGNRSSSWSIEAPHVYYINRMKSISRNLAMQNMLEYFGYSYTRVIAITPKDLCKSNKSYDNSSLVNMATTSSHLQSIYTAVRDYKLQTSNYKKSVHYALIMEDDPSFLFDIRDWKGFIKSAPTN